MTEQEGKSLERNDTIAGLNNILTEQNSKTASRNGTISERNSKVEGPNSTIAVFPVLKHK